MFNNRKNLLFVIYLFLPALMFAQVRNYVGVVRQQYYPDYIEQIKSYSEELKKDGYNTYSKVLDSFIESGFGSGFVYVAENGENFVITNRHVVSQAVTASFEIEDSKSGELVKYENLKVVLTNDDIDVAILAFPEGEKPFKTGLNFYTGELKDGQEVWSAGYPGLGSEPLWQFGKGVVTNSNANIKDLLDPQISSLIQHSAQVDSGNSGGPLLIESSSKSGYSVVGINTWKAFFRDSTNFAIPAKVIVSLIDELNKEKNDETEIKLRVEKFIEKISSNNENADYSSIVNFISYKKASVDGEKDFESVLNFAPNSVKNDISSVFSSNPGEGMRYACAYSLWNKIKNKDYEKLEISSIKVDGDVYNVEINATTKAEEDKEAETEVLKSIWVKEHGLWRYGNNSSDEEVNKKGTDKVKEKSKSSHSSVSFMGLSTYDLFHINVGLSKSLKDKQLPIDFSLDFYTFQNGLLGMSTDYSILKLDGKISGNFNANFAFRLPFDFDLFVISPYVEVGLGAINFLTEEQQLGYVYEFGGKIIFDLDWYMKPGIGLSYKAYNVFASEYFDDEEILKKDYISLYVIFAF